MQRASCIPAHLGASARRAPLALSGGVPQPAGVAREGRRVGVGPEVAARVARESRDAFASPQCGPELQKVIAAKQKDSKKEKESRPKLVN